MSWIQRLYETYEACLNDKKFSAEKNKLLPLSHAFQQAHIEIIINGDGEFLSASVISKEEIILPATEASAGRTTNDAPHALADKIQYCAKDYPDFAGKKKSYFNSYLKQLEEWSSSKVSTIKVKAVCAYVKKGCLVSDLINSGVLHVNKDNQLITEWNSNETVPLLFKYLIKKKESGKNIQEQADALVRWRVQIPGDENDATWLDPSIYKSWIEYCFSQETNKSLCQVSGKTETIAKVHPRRLRNPSDGAKLISTPTNEGLLTYQGRFRSFEQACQVSFVVTQKAHSALRWLIARQGYNRDRQVFVAWSVAGKELPNPLSNTYEIFSKEFLEDNAADIQSLLNGNKINLVSSQYGDVGQTFALKLNKQIAGYSAQLTSLDNIVVMGLDSASEGRIAITYYRELTGSEFLERIKKWHLSFAWPLRFDEKYEEKGKKKAKVVWRICAPSPKDIAEAVCGYGPNEKLRKSIIERLLPCIVDARLIPQDLIKMLLNSANNRIALENWQWEKTLGIACALYKGYYVQHSNFNERRNYEMALEKTRDTRDYLYGRLLAFAEKIEDYALFLADESRDTTAAKLMRRFSDRPYTTWKIIETSLMSYKSRIRNKSPGYLMILLNEMDDVFSLFKPGDFENKERLSGEFLLGYHCQRQELKFKKPEVSLDKEIELTTENL